VLTVLLTVWSDIGLKAHVYSDGKLTMMPIVCSDAVDSVGEVDSKMLTVGC